MRQHDLVIVGAGSGNAVIDDSFRELDVAIVSDGPFGGTCLNVGCIPSKMLVLTAEVADTVRNADTFDIDAELRSVRWRDVQRRIFGRLDEVAEDGKAGRETSDFVTVYTGHATFTGPRQLRVVTDKGPVDLHARQIAIAAGSRPIVPPVVADSGVPFETSDTIMRIDEPPRRLAILGGGYIAAELAHVFAPVGSSITIIERADSLLGPQDELVAQEYTKIAADQFDLRLGVEATAVEGEAGAIRVTLDDSSVVEADMLLVAVGRAPNGDRLDLDRAGIDTHDDGRIAVDRYQRATSEGVFALGDVCTPVPLKHVANREASVVAHNLLHPDDLIESDHKAIPAAVFISPQIASVGATEQDCREQGIDYVVGIKPYSDVAYGWALEDNSGFCKVLAERDTGRLLGAHILGPQAATLIQPLVLALTFDIDIHALSKRPYWIHPALTEVVENALLALGNPEGRDE